MSLGSQERGEKMLGPKNIKAENALDSTRDIKVQIQEAEQTSDDTYLKKSRLRHFFAKPQRTRQTSCRQWEKGCWHVREIQLEQQWTSPQSLQRRQRRGENWFQVLKEKKCEPESDIRQTYPSGMKARQDILKWRDVNRTFFPQKTHPQRMAKGSSLNRNKMIKKNDPWTTRKE